MSREAVAKVQRVFQEGLLFFDKQEWSEAIKRFEVINELDPNFVASYFYLSLCHLALGELENAHLAVNSGLAKHPNHSLGNNVLSLLAFEEKRTEEAFQMLKRSPMGELPRVQAFFLFEIEKLLLEPQQ